MWSGVLGSSLQPSQAGCSWVLRLTAPGLAPMGSFLFVNPYNQPGPCMPALAMGPPCVDLQLYSPHLLSEHPPQRSYTLEAG